MTGYEAFELLGHTVFSLLDDSCAAQTEDLLDLTPETAEVRQADGAWREVPAAEVKLEACVRVKPGTRSPG